MPRFFISESDIHPSVNGTTYIYIKGNDAHHISGALRMVPNDRLIACDGNCNEYECIIKSISNVIELQVISSHKSINEPPYKVYVYQALVKGDKFDHVIQKSIECGAYAIIPYISSRCIVKLDYNKINQKLSRWQKISYEAAKQCGRGIIPKVYFPVDFNEMIAQASKSSLGLFCYENGTVSAKSFCRLPHDTISIVIGPEGGFSKEEADLASESHLNVCSLGNRILRTETAAQFLLACLCYEYDM